MANEGYLIGYEDAQGNFVQIGQFNNAADDVTQPLVLRHTNSGETLELDGSSFRPSTQIGDTNNRPDLFANTVDLNTLVGADTKADLTQSGGVLVASQLPDLAITNIDVVADQTARLALNAEEGDVAIQTDISETFILSTNDPTVNSNWKKIQLDVLGAIDGQTITPAQTGTSTDPTDVEAGNILADVVDSNRFTPQITTGSNTILKGTTSGEGGIQIKQKRTTGVDSASPSVILQPDISGTTTAALITVSGNNSNVQFSDTVNMVGGGAPQVISSSESGSPAARNYSRSGTDLLLQMAAGNPVNISAVALVAIQTI